MAYLDAQIDAVEQAIPFGITGRVSAITGMTLEAQDLPVPVGALCRIEGLGGRGCIAEAIGFAQDRTLLMPLTGSSGISRGNRIENVASAGSMWCSPQLLGRVLNGLGEPMDGGPAVPRLEARRIDGHAVSPMSRVNIREPITTGIRSVDGLLTCGLGQRMGIFSGPGVGKSTLLSSVARNTSADVSVVALVGERGREVQEFLAESLGEEGLKRCVVVVSTGDEAPLLRVRAARIASTVAEYFRDLGLNVLLLVDSLTRLAQAQRQIGLAAREPPATKGYPPSVFSLLPEILERAGRSDRGSITGFYTVLVEGDDFNEPISDAVKGITDGHLWLSRDLANRGHFPAIDVLQSISRVRGDVAPADQVENARLLQRVLATYEQIEDLVNIGAYVPGENPEYDLAVKTRDKINLFLRQKAGEASSMEQTVAALNTAATWVRQTEKTLAANRQSNQQANPSAAQDATG